MSPQEKLKLQLDELARNLWWSWNPEVIRLFRDLDPKQFQTTNHNAYAVVQALTPERIERLAGDAFLRARVDRAHREFRDYLSLTNTWALTHAAPLRVRPVAYLSAEFGLHESLPIYSGGLGVLAGDHLKSASDLGLPLVGVGLLYRQGYFRQYLNIEGWQQEFYPENDFYNLPLRLERDGNGLPLTVELDFPGRGIKVHVWRVQVGRIPLYLLDTNLEENAAEDREITTRLYGGDQ